PARQDGQLPQESKLRTTLSPAWKSLSCAPPWTTTPAPSWPSTHGSGNGVACERTLRSVWHMPTATILTRSSSGRGSPISTSSSWNGVSRDSTTAAVIFTRVLSSVRRTTRRERGRSHQRGHEELVAAGHPAEMPRHVFSYEIGR